MYLGYVSEGTDRDRSFSTDSNAIGLTRHRFSRYSMNPFHHTSITNDESPIRISDVPSVPTGIANCQNNSSNSNSCCNDNPNPKATVTTENYLSIPGTSIATSSSLDTLTESTLSGPSSPSNLSSVTLVGSTGSGGQDRDTKPPSPSDDTKEFKYGTVPAGPLPERISKAKITADTPIKETIITYSLPPTVTTTTHFEGLGTRVTHAHREEPPVPPPRNRNPSITTTIAETGPMDGPSEKQNRRPSAGPMGIPHAVLDAHRRSLQLNGGDHSGLLKMGRVSVWRQTLDRTLQELCSLLIRSAVIKADIDWDTVGLRLRTKIGKRFLAVHPKSRPGLAGFMIPY